jgi:uncharacterized membrane protein YadS
LLCLFFTEERKVKMDTSSFLPLSVISSLITDSLFSPFDNSAQMWLLIAPLAALQLGLMIFALLDWARRPRTRYLDRWVWLPIIVIFGLVGPVAYFFLGREEE